MTGVLPSHSVPTLVGFAVLTAGLFAFQGILDAIRGRVLLRIGAALNDELSMRAYDAVARLPLKKRGGGDGLQPIRDLDQIRSFLSSAGPSALFDLPWMPLYVGICFLFHPLIGIAAGCGALILVVLTVMTEAVTRAPAKAAVGFAAARHALLEASRRNAEVLQAMGMSKALSARFGAVNEDYLSNHRRASDRAGMIAAFSRVIRLVAAVFGARPWCLFDDPSGGDTRRDHCERYINVTRVGPGRVGHRQLEGICGGAPGLSPPL
jgi:ATP-binding cassette subfamily C protein